MNNFWQDLKNKKQDEPIMVLAPMADVTDAAFRFIIAKYAKPDAFWTEFVSADGLVLAPERGREKLLQDLKYSEKEHPIVAQLFGSKPENMEKAACLVDELGFDGIDINMGCPDRSIEKQGAGASMIKNKDLAKRVVEATQNGAPNLPISIKIRLGYNTDEMEDWISFLLKIKPALITVHARTRKEMSKVPAKWERIKKAVEIRNEISPQTLIFGNGDIFDLKTAKQKFEETNCDGVMVGRGIFGNPWFFSGYEPGVKERLMVLIEHIRLFEEKIKYKNFAVMKKHFKAYVEGFDGAKELRLELMETNDANEACAILDNFLNNKLKF